MSNFPALSGYTYFGQRFNHVLLNKFHSIFPLTLKYCSIHIVCSSWHQCFVQTSCVMKHDYHWRGGVIRPLQLQYIAHSYSQLTTAQTLLLLLPCLFLFALDRNQSVNHSTSVFAQTYRASTTSLTDLLRIHACAHVHEIREQWALRGLVSHHRGY